MKPQSLDPLHIFGHKCFGVERTCNGCGVTFSLEEGVAYRDHFLDSEQVLHYNYLAFCDMLCILEHWCHRGEA